MNHPNNTAKKQKRVWPGLFDFVRDAWTCFWIFFGVFHLTVYPDQLGMEREGQMLSCPCGHRVDLWPSPSSIKYPTNDPAVFFLFHVRRLNFLKNKKKKHMAISYSDVVRAHVSQQTFNSAPSIVQDQSTRQGLVGIYENHAKKNGSAPSLQQLFNAARNACAVDHDKDVV